MVSSLLSLIDWWLSKDLLNSIERMAMIHERLFIQGTWHAMGAENTFILPRETDLFSHDPRKKPAFV